MPKPVSGFSKKNKEEKIDWLLNNYLSHLPEAKKTLKKYWNADSALQKLHDDFIENTLSNYYLPFSIAPNFLVNNTLYAIPMVIEESSVVAAASNAAKFWLDKGGFQAEVVSTQKNGQVHINYYGDAKDLQDFFNDIKPLLVHAIDDIAKNMTKRGGGLLDIELVDASQTLEGYYQLHCPFETLVVIGANFIHSCFAYFSKTFETEGSGYKGIL